MNLCKVKRGGFLLKAHMKSAVIQKKSVSSVVTTLHEHFRPFMGYVDDLITEKLQSAIPLAHQAATHMILAGGKRLRPLLTLSFYGLFSKTSDLSKNPCYLATAVEFIHTATLLHDDVIDNASKRRNFPTTNAVFGNALSVLAGDFLFARSFELMVQAHSLKALEILSTASSKIVEGEILQLSRCYDSSLDRKTALQVATLKTGTLFAAACEVGALIAGADEESCKKSYNYGLYLGQIFQLVDDILDYFGHAPTLGKVPGTDFFEKKMTLPVVLALEEASQEEKLKAQELFDSDDLESFTKLLRSLNAKEKSFAFANSLAKQATQSLPQGDPYIYSLLEDLITESLQRQY